MVVFLSPLEDVTLTATIWAVSFLHGLFFNVVDKVTGG